jgi:DNA-binding LacI/PurR family transcriptional regulator
MARVTLQDVAAHVGVSAKTVSNVVNGTGWVGDTVRQRVQDAIATLGYRPNLAARELRHGRSGLIALGLPDLREPYFAELAAHFVNAAQSRGRTVLVTQTNGDHAAERALIDGEGLPSVDAIVLSPLALTGGELANRTQRTPLVLLGEQAEVIGDQGYVHLGALNIDAARTAVEYLLGAGRRRIAAIGVQSGGANASSTLRLRGYEQALEAAGVPLSPELLSTVSVFTRAEGTRAVIELIRSNTVFDALFCFNDSLAFGALHALALNGIRVPTDVAVVGFDNVEEGQYSVPPLTTVGPSPEQVSRRAFELVEHILESPSGWHTIPHELVIRGSA